jgi:4-hydroxy-tetrahydrodipicolinate reductase
MNDTQPYRILFYGLGEIGARALRIALERKNLRVVGAVDVDRGKTGRDLAELAGFEKKTGVLISSNPEQILYETKPDVVIHSTVSSIEEAAPQIETIALAGSNCISSTEELFYPRPDTKHLFVRLNELALKMGVSIFGTGVNPGFAMDVLPLLLTMPCREVEAIKVERVVDAATRRMPLQRKVGLGLLPDDFRKRVRRKEMGHKGLTESIYCLSAGLGWKLDKVEESIEPVLAERRTKTQYFTVESGQTLGLKHIGSGIKDGLKVIRLDLQMYAGAENPHDRVVIEGTPSLEASIRGGIPGDDATAAILVNSVSGVIKSTPGLIDNSQRLLKRLEELNV